ncbi:hypothetical protein RJ639_003517 [Escallonia herrerae]|uniref:RNA polymerase II-associated factor 1 n=1 Tax=Escallonia herrerae TaxID=1293975 RepID=A0AA88W927_9ASTE|nr:hypothetical protein RJ639_003517 [Escallonia herrerae]
MASYRPFPPPPQSTFAAPQPNQNPLPPPPAPPPQSRGGNSQYTQSWGGYAGGGDAPPNYTQNYTQMHPAPPNYQQHYAPPPPPPPRNQIPQPPQQYPYPPPPPPPESSYPPPLPPSMPINVPPQPAPPASMYYPSSQYSHFNHHQPPLQPLQPPPPPPPPPSSPPSSSFPPPPPPTQPPSPPPPPAITQSGESKPAPTKQHRAAIPPIPGRKSNGPSGGRIETEEERRVRKKKDLEKQRQDDKHRQQLKDSQNKVLQKTQMLSSGIKAHGSISGSHMGDRRATPFLSGERSENRLKKPTTFLCKLKFRNELPDPTAQPKLLSLRRDKDRFTKYAITSLENLHKPQLYVEPDLGIPLDLLDLSVYNPSKGEKLHLDPEDEELLRDDDPVTPIKKDGFKRKERPTDQGFSWLVKTQYISPLSMEATKQSLTEKQAKELRDNRGGRNILDKFNNRERKIQEIEASFESCKSRPVHATNKKLQPIEIMPLLPDFDRYDDQFVVATFDSAPTADSEIYSKLEKPVRDAHESQAIMKSFMATTSDSAKPDKFLAYMVPSTDELSKDIYDEHEDVSFTWVREYHYDVRGDTADDPTTYLVAFGESEARYAPLPTKLILRKKRAKEGKSSEEVEHFPVPLRVTVRRRSTVSAVELKEPGSYSSTKGSSKTRRVDMEGRRQHVVQDTDMDQSSGAEYSD